MGSDSSTGARVGNAGIFYPCLDLRQEAEVEGCPLKAVSKC